MNRRVKIQGANGFQEGDEKRIVHEFVNYATGLLQLLGMGRLRFAGQTQ